MDFLPSNKTARARVGGTRARWTGMVGVVLGGGRGNVCFPGWSGLPGAVWSGCRRKGGGDVGLRDVSGLPIRIRVCEECLEYSRNFEFREAWITKLPLGLRFRDPIRIVGWIGPAQMASDLYR